MDPDDWSVYKAKKALLIIKRRRRSYFKQERNYYTSGYKGLYAMQQANHRAPKAKAVFAAAAVVSEE